jgi:hypothetical protein
MGRRFTLAVAALGAVLVLGALAWGTALAPTPTPTPRLGEMHGTLISRAAAILGVPEAKLTDALTQAHDQALDDAAQAGQLTQAQADWMKQHMRAGATGTGMMGGTGILGAGVGMMGSGGTMPGHAAMMGGAAAAERCLGARTPDPGS